LLRTRGGEGGEGGTRMLRGVGGGEGLGVGPFMSWSVGSIPGRGVQIHLLSVSELALSYCSIHGCVWCAAARSMHLRAN
jgi:hypothetical protein